MAMKVKDVMMGTPAYCELETNLGEAAELMASRNCGILPVIDVAHKVIGVVTDRDMCLALAGRTRHPSQIAVREVATRNPYCCKASDELRTAMETMTRRQVRRLPVIRQDGTLEAILSMDNIVLHADADTQKGAPEISDAAIVHTFRGIYGPSLPRVVGDHAVA
jgi:CBS domain-containing protein